MSRTLLNNKALLFGRKVPNEPERGTLRLDHDSISREHAVIVHAFSGETFVCELGSRYGTKHNGEPLKAKVYTAIKEGDELQFGESTRRYIFYRHPPPPPRTGKEVRAPLSEPAAAASSSARAPALAAGADPPRPPLKPPPKPPPPMEEYEPNVRSNIFRVLRSSSVRSDEARYSRVCASFSLDARNAYGGETRARPTRMRLACDACAPVWVSLSRTTSISALVRVSSGTEYASPPSAIFVPQN